LVLYDPGPRGTIADARVHTAAGYSPFQGMDVTGRVVTTVLRGRVAYDGTDVVAAEGSGRLIRRSPVRPRDLP